MNIEELYRIYLNHRVICTDTRKISSGCLFFALKGENFDGNSFAQQALDAGSAYAVIDDATLSSNERFIQVDDVLVALQQLANRHRKSLSIPFIAITGTNGKTTTKELIRSVLAVKYNTYATAGNLNNHIGVPLTILAVDNHTEVAIIEMGANHQQEIAGLCQIAEPDFGLITNVGKGHLEGFGGFEGVKKAKGELYDYLSKKSGLVFANQDNAHLSEMLTSRNVENVQFYSTSTNSALRGEVVENNPFLIIDWIADSVTHRVKTNLTGSYNLENILAAIAIGWRFNLTAEEINQGIASYNPGNNRSQIKKTETNILICDFYNANPNSMHAALDNFAAIEASNKVLILGDMFELGDDAEAEHQLVLEKAMEVVAGDKIFVGKNFYQNQKVGAQFYDTIGNAVEHLKAYPVKNATILIKGSRGMQLEKLVELL